MAEIRARWLAFYSEHVEPVSKEIFSYVERMIIGTLIVSAGAHVSSNEPAIRAVRVICAMAWSGAASNCSHHPADPEFPRRLLQAVKAQLACGVPGIDVVLLFRAVDTADPVDSCLSWRTPAIPGIRCRVAAARDLLRPELAQHVLTSRRKQRPHWWRGIARSCRRRALRRRRFERTSPPQAERSTNSSSRGRSGRSTITTGAARCRRCGRRRCSQPKEPQRPPRAAAPPVAAATTFSQPAESFALFFSRHCSAGAPPVGTPAQTLG